MKIESIKPEVMQHKHVCSHDNMLSVVVESSKWGFGFRFANYTNYPCGEKTYGFRIQFYKWHLMWWLKGKL